MVGSRWIYKVKHAADRSMDKYKAGFVGINYEPSSFGEAAQHDVWQEAMVEV